MFEEWTHSLRLCTPPWVCIAHSCTAALQDERLTSTAGWWAEAAVARSSFIRVEPHCERRHCCTTGREASEQRWTVGRGGDNVLLRSSTAGWMREWTWVVERGGDDVLLHSSGSAIAHGAVRMASTAKSASTRALRHCSPKSGDTTRCVNVVDNHGFPPVRMDNQQRFVDKTMIWQCETFKNVKLG